MKHGPWSVVMYYLCITFSVFTFNLITQWTWYSKSFKAISIYSVFTQCNVSNAPLWFVCELSDFSFLSLCRCVCVFRLRHFLIPLHLHSKKCQLKRIGRAMHDAMYLEMNVNGVLVMFIRNIKWNASCVCCIQTKKLYETTKEKIFVYIMQWHCSLR